MLPKMTQVTLLVLSVLVTRIHCWIPGQVRVAKSTRLTVSTSSEAAPAAPSPSAWEEDLEEAAFQARCKQLCAERNLKLEKVKNARDLASVRNSPVKPGRLYRTGRLSDATDADVKLLMDELKLQTLVDLRSPTELKEDPTLMREEVFGDFATMLFRERGRGQEGCLTPVKDGKLPLLRKRDRLKFWSKTTTQEFVNSSNLDENESEEELCDLECEPGSVAASNGLEAFGVRRERHFCSIMNEFKYVLGTISKIRKRDLTKALIRAPGALVSKRVRTKVKKPFLDEINGGGLPLLNEVVLKGGAPGIRYVLELCADRRRHPVAFYCTAGKDRTGVIAAIILGVCGAKSEDIVEDYSLSANVYAEMNDHKAMVGALSQRSLDPKTFLGAPPQVMRDTLVNIENEFGSVEGYCDWIGFGPEKREKLRKACMAD